MVSYGRMMKNHQKSLKNRKNPVQTIIFLIKYRHMWNFSQFKTRVTHRVLSFDDDEDKSMTKVVINRCFGGFGLSNQAFEMLMDAKGVEYDRVPTRTAIATGRSGGDLWDYYTKGHAGETDHYLWYYQFTQDRSDSDLVDIVERLGKLANSWASDLKIVEIPDDVEWCVIEYDGMEHVAEKHRTWS